MNTEETTNLTTADLEDEAFLKIDRRLSKATTKNIQEIVNFNPYSEMVSYLVNKEETPVDKRHKERTHLFINVLKALAQYYPYGFLRPDVYKFIKARKFATNDKNAQFLSSQLFNCDYFEPIVEKTHARQRSVVYKLSRLAQTLII